MTYEEALLYLHSLPRFGGKPGLERIRMLCDALGNPEKALGGRFLHVAGTNGKGSVCAFLDAVLRRGGYHVGRFTSPYLTDFRERIAVDGELVLKETVARNVTKIRDAVTALGTTVCEFEAVTALGLCCFHDAECDLVVWETGLGGRHDPTNVVDPLLSVITHIALDHVDVLGDTVEKIAWEKAGIIKPGRPAVIAPGQDAAALAVLFEEARTAGAPVCLSKDATWRQDGDAAYVRYEGEEYALAMTGTYQKDNAAAALTALSLLPGLGFPVQKEAVREGMKEVSFPARFERLRDDPPFYLDGAHNRDGLVALRDSVLARFGDEKPVAICGMLRDKNPRDALRAVSQPPIFEKVYCITPDTPRAMPAEELAALFDECGIPAVVCETIPAAVLAALFDGKPVTAFGSLYSAGAVRDAVLTSDAGGNCYRKTSLIL